MHFLGMVLAASKWMICRNLNIHILLCFLSLKFTILSLALTSLICVNVLFGLLQVTG